MSDTIKVVDGPKRVFATGAESQDANGKGTPVLVPGDAILDVAKHFENGASLYGARNWEKGIPLSELLNSLERHLQQEKMGMTDEPHARALAWRAMVYLATKLRIEAGLLPSELADMPDYEIQGDYNAVEIDGPHVFKKGDRVKISPTTEGNSKVSSEVTRQLKNYDYTGTVIEDNLVGVETDCTVDIGGVTYFFFASELALLEDN